VNEYRSDLPNRPDRMKDLPLDERGFPVPWFVAWIDNKPDFRIIRERGVAMAHNHQTCWLCGHTLGRYLAFVIGPMCGINRTSAEPPSHLECADYAARACPFLTRPMAVRDERGLEGMKEPAGVMIKRNPGVAMVWITRGYKPFRAPPNGVLFRIGDPTEIRFYTKGRRSSRAEIEESVNTGLPFLEKAAEQDGPTGRRELEKAKMAFARCVDKWAGHV